MLVPAQLIQLIVYNEAYLSSSDAAHLERCMKTARGGKNLTKRLHDWIAAINLNKLERH
jgi:hypothetical protein